MMNKKNDIQEHYSRYYDYIKAMVYGCTPYCLNNPLEIYLELTNQCNLSCVYCYKSDILMQKEKEELPFKIILNILDQIVGTDCLLILEGGEPFLHTQILLILEECMKRNIHTDILTNGTLLQKVDLSSVEKAFENKLFDLQISLDGQKEFNKFNRGVWGDEIICEIVKLNKHGIIPRVQTVVTVNTIHGIIAFLKEINSKLNVSSVTLNVPFGKKNLNLIPSKQDIQKLNAELNDVMSDFKFSVINSTNIIDGNCGMAKTRKEMFIRCTAMRSKLCITHNGDVYPCVFFENHMEPLGNVENNRIDDIWNSQNAFAFRKMLKQETKECSQCEWSKTCTQKCMARKY